MGGHEEGGPSSCPPGAPWSDSAPASDPPQQTVSSSDAVGVSASGSGFGCWTMFSDFVSALSACFIFLLLCALQASHESDSGGPLLTWNGGCVSGDLGDNSTWHVSGFDSRGGGSNAMMARNDNRLTLSVTLSVTLVGRYQRLDLSSVLCTRLVPPFRISFHFWAGARSPGDSMAGSGETLASDIDKTRNLLEHTFTL